MKHSYIILDDDKDGIMKTRAIVAGFQNLHFVASATNYEDGLNLILEYNPDIVFLEIDPADASSNLSLRLIDELHRYLKKIPQIIIASRSTLYAFESINYDVLNYLLKPIDINELRKTILKYEKSILDKPQYFNHDIQSAITAVTTRPDSTQNKIDDSVAINTNSEELIVSKESKMVDENQTTNNEELLESEILEQLKEASANENMSKVVKPLIICVKSYGDYRFIEAKDICYLQADNNSTDIHLNNGEMITAFKTLKHFEGVLASPFVRIHNSYIVNIDYVSRIHTGNSVCYIKNTTTKLPFSKSYKENVDSIINSITNGNYLEI